MKKLATAAVVVLSVGVAAGAHQPIHITSTFAHVEVFNSIVVPVATCQGVDGVYVALHVTGQGPITSPDPRLSGTFIVDAMILDNPNTGVGMSTDNFRVVDPATGELKWQGTAWAIDAMPSAIKSLVMGELVDGTKFAALATVLLPPPGSSAPIIIEYGGAGSGDAADRAVLISGDCAKLFKHWGFR